MSRELDGTLPAKKEISCSVCLSLQLEMTLRLLPHAQTMDLPVLSLVEVWPIMRDYMPAKEWARACGTNRATYAMRRQLVAAEIHTCETIGRHDQDITRQLRLDRWPTCHSLFLNLHQLPEGFQATTAESNKIRLAGDKLSMLHCLHILGRGGVLLTENSMEGFLVSILARRVLVLTLEIKTLEMPLTLPTLQHLVLYFGQRRNGDPERIHEKVFPAISMLKRLTTLYIKSSQMRVGFPNLRNCVHLRHVALQGVSFMKRTSSTKLTLPTGCQLHELLTEVQGEDIYYWSDSDSGVIVHHDSILGVEEWAGGVLTYSNWNTNHGLHPHRMTMLKQLRLVLSGTISGTQDKEPLYCHFSDYNMPALEVLELDVQCNLQLYIDLDLKSAVVIAAGTLYINMRSSCTMQRLPSCMFKRATTFGPAP